jgi:hypothetical protein
VYYFAVGGGWNRKNKKKKVEDLTFSCAITPPRTHLNFPHHLESAHFRTAGGTCVVLKFVLPSAMNHKLVPGMPNLVITSNGLKM